MKNKYTNTKFIIYDRVVDHTEDCPWHQDWHACNCGGLDLPEKENE